MTLPLIYTLANADKALKRKIINIIKNHNTDPKRVEEVIAWVKAGDGIRYAEQRMAEYRDKALTALEAFPESAYRTSFINLVRYTTDRKK